jgi:hypothetical protein
MSSRTFGSMSTVRARLVLVFLVVAFFLRLTVWRSRWCRALGQRRLP